MAPKAAAPPKPAEAAPEAAPETPVSTSNERPAPMQPEMSIAYLQHLAEVVKWFDSQIAQASGQGAAAKKAVRERIAGEVKSKSDAVLQKIGDAFGTVDDRVLVGVLNDLDTLLTGLKERADKIVTEEQGKTKGSASGDTEGLKEQRKKTRVAFDSLKNLLEGTMDLDTSSVVLPKRGGGGTGKKGTRTKSSGFDFFIEGKAQSESQNTFSGTAFYAVKGGTGTIKEAEARQSAYLKEVLVKNGIPENPKDWPDTWTVKLPNGKVVSAKKRPPAPVEEASETETPANA
jgi:hypothetical protein